MGNNDNKMHKSESVDAGHYVYEFAIRLILLYWPLIPRAMYFWWPIETREPHFRWSYFVTAANCLAGTRSLRSISVPCRKQNSFVKKKNHLFGKFDVFLREFCLLPLKSSDSSSDLRENRKTSISGIRLLCVNVNERVCKWGICA